VSRPVEPLPDELRSEISASLKDEVERLSELLGRDLMSWLRPDEALPAAPGLEIDNSPVQLRRAAYSR
jgi:hypothetical protein